MKKFIFFAVVIAFLGHSLLDTAEGAIKKRNAETVAILADI